MAKTYLKVLKDNCSRLIKSLMFEALLCYFLVCRFLLLSLPAMPMMAVCGKSRLLCARFCTGAHHRCRVVE
jgi:hypothetical protein